MKVISSRTHQLIKDIVRLVKEPGHRKEKGLFVIEGISLLREVLKTDYEIEIFLFTGPSASLYKEVYTCQAKANDVYEITDSVAEKLSGQNTTQGIFCVLKCKEFKLLEDIATQSRVVLAEHIADPTNLGAIARSAVAFGFNTLIISFNSADWLSLRAQRAAMGALLHINILIVDIAEAISFLKQNEFFLLAAAISENAKDIGEIEAAEKTALVIGNETNGLKSDTILMCDEVVSIETDERIQSLNAATAASILMFYLR